MMDCLLVDELKTRRMLFVSGALLFIFWDDGGRPAAVVHQNYLVGGKYISLLHIISILYIIRYY